MTDRYEQDPAARAAGVLHPARDTVSGAVVSVLAVGAPEEPGGAARELERLRRLARVHHPRLARVRDVEAAGGRLRVVCEPLTGEPPTLEQRAFPLSVRAVQRLAGGVLDALAALHRAGVVHGAVGERSLLLSRPAGPAADVEVTLLPVPLPPPPLHPGGPEPVPPAARADATPEDDVADAAATLLTLLHRTPKVGMEDAVLSAGLSRALERARTTPATGAPAVPATPAGAPTPAPGSPSQGHRGGAHRASSGTSGQQHGPRGRPAGHRHRWGAVAAVAALLAAGVAAAVLLPGRGDDRRAGAAADAARSSLLAPGRVTAPPTPSPTPPPAVPLATAAPASAAPHPAPARTVAGLVADLAARPGDAGPAGPLLLAGLQGLQSGDDGTRERSALQVLSVLVDGQGLDPAYATAGRLALFQALTDRGTPAAGAPAATGAPAAPGTPSCLRVVAGRPAPVVQAYAQQVVDRLPRWRADGFPPDEAGRVQDLLTPVADGRAQLALQTCPDA